ncbi:MATE family efflux transporter [Listeria booriae]|uniref:Multidrug export protein MepA n=1 Tax=Listeria booriae TaxID=1552123 RepID=A0A099WDE0_9LIST|nr:MATE family efflux transporter [Listeria booriae]KGL42523.1 multidrug transporter MatE [Listeria booriae]MBC1211871.1 MATE family efflux transporter [Listeria booriae]MBC1227953.1 MATE family efflux transporter [Listeria booriae]MBC1231653.1 MATE family efflux transporter [Listeria booriae]MBC1233455.1 MATE family efflux transporter [Listeria booriae]
MKEQSKRLGEDKIGSLMWRLSVPAFIGMFVMGMYNIVDTIFVARGVGSLGVAALSIAFPVQMIMMAMAAMFGIGGASIISRALGAGDQERANKVYHQVIWLVVISSLLLALVTFVYLDPLITMFGATPEIHQYAKDFLQILLLGSVFQTFGMAMNNIVRSEGNAKIAMLTMIISAVLNMILNPIFIMGLDWGIRGSAFATLIAQAVGAAWLLIYFLSGKSSLTLRGFRFHIDWKLSGSIVAIGFPSFIMMSAGSIVSIAVNWMLNIHGGTMAIAAYGVANRIASFMIMPINGVTQGMQPIVGFNYGSREYKRVIKAVKLSIIAATAMSIIAFVVVELFPDLLVSVFTEDKALLRDGAHAVQVVLLAAPTIGFQIVCGGLYQALGRARISFVISLMRQIICLVPLLLILPNFWGLDGVWYAFPLADVGAFTVCLIIMLRTWRGLFKNPEMV